MLNSSRSHQSSMYSTLRDLSLRVWFFGGLVFGFWFGVWGFGFWVLGFGVRIFGFGAWGFGSWVLDFEFGFWVSGSGCQHSAPSHSRLTVAFGQNLNVGAYHLLLRACTGFSGRLSRCTMRSHARQHTSKTPKTSKTLREAGNPWVR